MNTIRLGGIQYLNLIPDFKKIRRLSRAESAETYDHPDPAPSKTRDHLLSGARARLAFNNTSNSSIQNILAAFSLLLQASI